MPDGGVAGFLLDARAPDAVALRFEHDAYTYGDLERAAAQIACYVSALGFAKGERALLVADNSFFWVASYLGLLRAGVVSVPVPPTIAPRDLRHIAEATDAAIVFLESRALSRHLHALDRRYLVTDETVERTQSERQTSFAVLRETPSAHHTFPPIAPDDLAALMFTSGSTGVPRGVMVTHGNIIANTASIIETLQLTARDSVMAVLPFCYCFGTSLLHTHLRVGGSLVVDSRFMYVETILQRLVESACTGFAGVPSHFQILLRSSSLRTRRFPHLRYVQQAGGHLAPPLIDQLRAALPQTGVFIMYGQTEATARLSCLSPELLDAKRGSIGTAIPGVRLRVVNEAGEDVRPRETGEIVAEGQNITKGYWQAPEESAASFREGKLHTGDLATVDEDGFIYLVGRAKDFLKIRGERIGCQMIEAQLLAFDELLEAAVVGTPDPVLGEAAKAFVVARNPSRDGLAERVRDFCKRQMLTHLVPKEIVVVPALPKNSAGKVIKRNLETS
jgi:long-chain acyl-CoA synthetase